MLIFGNDDQPKYVAISFCRSVPIWNGQFDVINLVDMKIHDSLSLLERTLFISEAIREVFQ